MKTKPNHLPRRAAVNRQSTMDAMQLTSLECKRWKLGHFPVPTRSIGQQKLSEFVKRIRDQERGALMAYKMPAIRKTA